MSEVYAVPTLIARKFAERRMPEVASRLAAEPAWSRPFCAQRRGCGSRVTRSSTRGSLRNVSTGLRRAQG